MILTEREKAIAIISNGIAAYATYLKEGALPEGTSLADFVIRGAPESVKPQITASLLDELVSYMGTAHNS